MVGDAPPLVEDINDFSQSKFWLEDGIRLFCGNIYEYIRETIQAKDHPNVYILVYEKLLKDPKKEISKLLEFMEESEETKKLDDELIEKIVSLTNMEQMKDIEDKFSEYWITRQQLTLGRYSPFYGPLIPSSKVGLSKKEKLATESIVYLENYWKTKFPEYDSYDSMINTLDGSCLIKGVSQRKNE